MNSTRVNATSKGIINLWKPVCTREYSLPIITIWWQCSWYSLSPHARILGAGFAFGFVFLLQTGSLSLSVCLWRMNLFVGGSSRGVGVLTTCLLSLLNVACIGIYPMTQLMMSMKIIKNLGEKVRTNKKFYTCS